MLIVLIVSLIVHYSYLQGNQHFADDGTIIAVFVYIVFCRLISMGFYFHVLYIILICGQSGWETVFVRCYHWCNLRYNL
jgi:hypothetical protein